jgi:hypothetical protein
MLFLIALGIWSCGFAAHIFRETQEATLSGIVHRWCGREFSANNDHHKLSLMISGLYGSTGRA